MISCIIPAHNEQDYIEWTLLCLLTSAVHCSERVEIIVIENGSRDRTKEIVEKFGCRYRYHAEASRVKAKNIGAFMAKGDTLAFVDADCFVSSDFFPEISEKAKNPFFVGGGVKWVRLSRYSLGLIVGCIVGGAYFILKGITVGAFWVRKDTFEKIGGFRYFHTDDVDFAIRLKRYAKQHHRKFESLKKTRLIWSTRRFDKEGDWKWIDQTWFSPEIKELDIGSKA